MTKNLQFAEIFGKCKKKYNLPKNSGKDTKSYNFPNNSAKDKNKLQVAEKFGKWQKKYNLPKISANDKKKQFAKKMIHNNTLCIMSVVLVYF